ncbi:MAG: hypothetical protein KF774_15420 [Planctomyces sp.]|nr:hypothetical protein [Planctomyces sp.]
MSADAFRFIHATNLRLDQPLTGAGSLSPDDRAIVEDATLTAFGRIVDACLEHDAEFLLLTGDCFEHQTGTLRGRLQMQRGLERLADHDVSVLIIPGSLDPPSSWRRGLTLPRNTTLFSSEDDEPVSIQRNGRVLASIAPVATAASDESNWRAGGPALWRAEPDVFRIGLIGAGAAIRWNGSQPEACGGPGASTAAATLARLAIDQGVNYLALGEGAERQTIDVRQGVAHDPGSPQGLNANESGAKGCSCVEVGPDGAIEIRFLPTAPVRWMSLTVDMPNHVDRDQLAERMALVVMEHEPAPGDDLWLIRWSLRDVAADWNPTLSNAAALADLWDRAERELASVGGPRRKHSLNAGCRPGVERRAIVREPGARDLCEEFCEQINEDAEAALDGVRLQINGPEYASGAWVRHVRQALQRTRPADIARRSRELGDLWLR